MQERQQPQSMLFFGTLSKWVIWGAIIGVIVGSTSAFLLVTNDYLGEVRENSPWLLLLLPLGGVIIGAMYKYVGKDSTKGNTLVWEHVQHGQGQVPLRMGPLVFIGTFITVLLGGSTGREGAAIQMGTSIAAGVNRFLRVNENDRRILFISGICGGFGSAFGAPVTGTIFGMEAIGMGKMGYEAIVPGFVASFVGHLVTTAWGIEHEHHVIEQVPALTSGVILRVALAAVAFGLVSMLYSQSRHWIEKQSILHLRDPMLRGFIGGLAIVGLTYTLGTTIYLGRGIEVIEQAFTGPVPPLAFLAKLLFTAITMGTGFRGGEVIPLFFMGATLGNALSPLLGLPLSFMVALGFMSVFCGAANTPIACFVFAVELFEGKALVFFFLSCLISFIVSGHHGIYHAQRIFEPKSRLFNLKPGTRIAALEHSKNQE